ncbi:hypothetical protein VE02_01221 [Pseudogymnoascus sp. 03VT05]|nr:hypothetical protein VE02_01221 [Pseudogymnoascus sp. 03VT05]
MVVHDENDSTHVGVSDVNKEKNLPPSFDGEETPRRASIEQFQEKKFGVISLLGMGYSISNTGMTCIGSLAASLGNGGPVVFIWGQILVFFMALCVATSLGELSSALPHAGGQYYWTAYLAPKRFKRKISYLVGLLSWGGAVVTAASGTLAIPQFVLGMVTLRDPDFVMKPWMIFVGFQITNIVVFTFNLCERLLPMFNLMSMSFSIGSMVTIFITLLVTTKEKQTGQTVFGEIINSSGWSNGVAFITALVGPNYGYACLDAVTHMAEEIPDPRRNIPKALLATVIVGLCTGLPFMIGVMFCIGNVSSVVGTATGVPSLQLFFNSIGSTAGAIGLQSLILVVFIGAVYGVHTWQSRMAWSFARDQGWPFSRTMSKLAPSPMNVPLVAHIWSCLWVAVLGCVYLGSSVAFNSFISGGILLQYISYSICIALLLIYGRDKLAHGPFWLPKWGLFANIMVLLWTSVTFIFYCFPVTYPVKAASMNYVSCVIVFMFLYAGIYWVAVGKKSYTLPRATALTEEVEGI